MGWKLLTGDVVAITETGKNRERTEVMDGTRLR
jgi:hypothetical protein